MARIANKSRLAIVSATPILIYVVIVPLLWPEPTLQVELPESARTDESVPIMLTLRGWHSNFEISNVRFYVDYHNSDVHGPNGPFYPQLVHQGDTEIQWTFWGVNRLTWPRSREMKVELPLAPLAADGVIKPGTVRGKIDVNLVYPDMHSEMVQVLGRFPNRTRMLSEAIEMQFLPADGPG